jgi:hypothetical protein
MKAYNLIFLRNSKVVLSKKAYSDWKEIQTEYEDYMSSLEFKSTEDLIEYLSFDYKISPEQIKSQIDRIKTTELEQIEISI